MHMYMYIHIQFVFYISVESYTVPSSRRCQTQAKFNVTPPTSFPDDEETISRALDHRASVKEVHTHVHVHVQWNL